MQIYKQKSEKTSTVENLVVIINKGIKAVNHYLSILSLLKL